MSMVRRSHLWGQYNGGTVGINPDYSPAHDPAFIPEGETVEVVSCEVPAGGVVFHHCRTWHGAPANHSGNPRPAIAVHYMPGWTRYEPSRTDAHGGASHPRQAGRDIGRRPLPDGDGGGEGFGTHPF